MAGVSEARPHRQASTGGRTLVLGWPGAVARAVVSALVQRGSGVVVVVDSAGAVDVPSEVETFTGNVTSIDFGLSGSDYAHLRQSASRVVVACQHDEAVSEVERSHAVRVAVEVVEFAQAGGGSKGVVFLSSLLALGSPRERVREGQLEIGQTFPSKYEEALAVSEKVVRKVASSAPLMVLRTAPICGWETTGELLTDSPLLGLARRIERAPPVGELAYRDEPVRFECVEPTCALLIRLLDAGESRTVHLADQSPITDRQLIDHLRDVFGRPPPAPVSVPFRMKLTLPGVPASHSVLGWRSRFDLSEAEQFCPELLTRQPLERLRRFFPVATREGERASSSVPSAASERGSGSEVGT